MSSSMTVPGTANLGFPAVGAQRELKWAVEAYWRGARTRDELHGVAASLRERHWRLQRECGIAIIPSNDFSFYDRMLDLSISIGAIPQRFAEQTFESDLDLMFAMARGTQNHVALEITKWFDTNYHYVVPELRSGERFVLRANPALDAYREAKALGIETRPVVIGPLTYLLLARYEGKNVLDLLPALLPIYTDMLRTLTEAGATAVQIDEPMLAMDLAPDAHEAYRTAYRTLHDALPHLPLMLTTYFGGLRDNLALACALPVAGIHLDLVRAPEELEHVLPLLTSGQNLSCGVVDGRNIWRNDLDASATLVMRAVEALGRDRVIIAPSCSLTHVPIDLELETAMDGELRSWLAFAKQKLGEIAALGACAQGTVTTDDARFQEAREALAARRDSPRIHDKRVATRVAALEPPSFERAPAADRRPAQRAALGLPRFPTTTIGSLPQTPEVRGLRKALRTKAMSRDEYDAVIREKTAEVIRWQEAAGVDVLVHGEFERTDMVEYFGEQLRGFATTEHGWVQSYGSRCVKPPLIVGDVARDRPMTVALSSYAQSLTAKPVKGMLTGPITILQWSFVRDDQPRKTTAMQIALALQDEVRDLEKAGLRIIQIDEPALREGLPLRTSEHAAYLQWSVDAFRLAAAGAASATQIHTHMCYAEFDQIMASIAAMDADVISIETARSAGMLFAALGRFAFPYMIGPGVYDIHSPIVPTVAEIVARMEAAERVIPADQLWVNPDCGLKTRRWEEVRPAIDAMVAAAKQLRATAAVPA